MKGLRLKRLPESARTGLEAAEKPDHERQRIVNHKRDSDKTRSQDQSYLPQAQRTFAQWLNETCFRFPRSSGRWHPRPYQSIASRSTSGLGVKTSRWRLTLASGLDFHV